jgi:hypothetical protein
MRKHRTRDLEIPGLVLTHHPGMTTVVCSRRAGVNMARLGAFACYIVFKMVLDRTSMTCRRVVIDDHARLPGRFFGRFATSATSELTRAL